MHPPPGITAPLVVSSPAEFAEALALRYVVFCDEQGIAREIERDAEDDVATHVIIRNSEGVVIATGRALRQLADQRLVGIRSPGSVNDLARIGRMAVRQDARRFGLGSQVLTTLETHARSAGLRTFGLHAQLTAEPFYLSCGYARHGAEFTEVDIPHIEMRKTVS